MIFSWSFCLLCGGNKPIQQYQHRWANDDDYMALRFRSSPWTRSHPATDRLVFMLERLFGFFHYADQTEVRVRNVTWRGDWPRALPTITEQELAGAATDEVERELAGLKATVRHDFSDDGLPRDRFAVQGDEDNSRVVAKADGLHVDHTGMDGYSSSSVAAQMRIHGNFEITASFESLRFTPSENGSCGISLTAILENDGYTHSTVHRGALIEDRKVKRQFAQAEFVRTPDDKPRLTWHGTIRLITGVQSNGSTHGTTSVIWKDLTIRAERITDWPATDHVVPRDAKADESKLQDANLHGGTTLDEWIVQAKQGRTLEDRENALQIVRNFGLRRDRDKALRAFTELLSDKALTVRSLSAAGLRRAGKPTDAMAAAKLVEIISRDLSGLRLPRGIGEVDHEFGLVLRVIGALEVIGETDHVPALKRVSENQKVDSIIRQAAEKAIRQIERRESEVPPESLQDVP